MRGRRTWASTPKAIKHEPDPEQEQGLTQGRGYGLGLLNYEDAVYPWMKQKGETDEEYFLLRSYIDQGPNRSLKSVADIYARSLEYIQGLALRCDWDQRAASYQAYIETSISNIVQQQIKADRTMASRIIGQVIDHKARRLAHKVLTSDSDEDTITDILHQLSTLTGIARGLKAGKEDSDQKTRSVNIMFAPVIQTGPHSSSEETTEVTFTEAEVTDDE